MATPHGLSRVHLVKNPNYKRSGLGSYAYALRKYNIKPTKEGPFKWIHKAEHQGKFGASVGGKTHLVNHLVQTHGHKTKHHHPASTDPNTGSNVPTSGPTTGSGSGTTGSGVGSTPQEGQVDALDIQNDTEYLCPVTIGTPGQKFMLDFDTGSADLWVWSIELPSSTTKQAGSSHTIYDPSKSSTYSAISKDKWQISYGDGSSASGTVGTDNVTVGGLVIQKQAVELAQKLSPAFSSGTGDGLLGLAWGSINTVTPSPVLTPVENMIAQNNIPKSSELFTAYLASWRDSADADKGQSFYTFGYIDQDVLSANNSTTEQIHYTPIDNSQGFWTFNSTSASINGKSISLSGNTAIADTGTTLCLVSDVVVEAVYAAIPGSKYDSDQQGYVFPLSTTADKLPVVQLDIGGRLFTINKEDLGFADAGNGLVYGGIQSRGQQDFDIFGDVLLKSIYAVFDQGNTRFGAVQRTEAIQNLAAPPSN